MGSLFVVMVALGYYLGVASEGHLRVTVSDGEIEKVRNMVGALTHVPGSTPLVRRNPIDICSTKMAQMCFVRESPKEDVARYGRPPGPFSKVKRSALHRRRRRQQRMLGCSVG